MILSGIVYASLLFAASAAGKAVPHSSVTASASAGIFNPVGTDFRVSTLSNGDVAIPTSVLGTVSVISPDRGTVSASEGTLVFASLFPTDACGNPIPPSSIIPPFSVITASATAYGAPVPIASSSAIASGYAPAISLSPSSVSATGFAPVITDFSVTTLANGDVVIPSGLLGTRTVIPASVGTVSASEGTLVFASLFPSDGVSSCIVPSASSSATGFNPVITDFSVTTLSDGDVVIPSGVLGTVTVIPTSVGTVSASDGSLVFASLYPTDASGNPIPPHDLGAQKGASKRMEYPIGMILSLAGIIAGGMLIL